MLLVLCLVWGLAAVSVVSGRAYADPPEWLPIEPAVPTSGNTDKPALAVDAKGRAVLAYEVVDYATNSFDVYATIRERTGTWTAPAHLGSGHSPQVAADASGSTTVVWEQIGPGYDIYSSVLPKASTTFGAKKKIATLDSPIGDLRLAVAPSGAAAVIWCGYPSSTSRTVGGVIRTSAGAWADPETFWSGPGSGGGVYGAVVPIGGDGFSVAFSTTVAARTVDLYRLDTTGTGFDVPEKFATVDGYEVRVTAAQAPGGSVAVAFAQSGAPVTAEGYGGITTVMARPAGEDWTSRHEVGRSAAGGGTVDVALAVDDSGATTAAWAEGVEDPTDFYNGGTVLHADTYVPGEGWSDAPDVGMDRYSFVQVVAAATPDGEHVLLASGTHSAKGTEPVGLWMRTRDAEGSWTGLDLVDTLADGLVYGNIRLQIGTDGTAVATFSDDSATVTGTSHGYDAFVSPGAGLLVDVSVYDDEGNPIDGVIAPGQYLLAVVSVENNTDETLTGLSFAGGAPLTIDSRSPGGVLVTQEPDAVPTSLSPGQQVSFPYTLTTTKRGKAASNTLVSATGQTSGEAFEEKQSLLFDIESGAVVDKALGQLVVLQAVDRYLTQAYNDFLDYLDKQAEQLKRQLKKVLPRAVYERWFAGGVSVSDHLRADQQGVTPASVNSHLPGADVKSHTVDELYDAYEKTFLAEVGNGVVDWAKNWKHVGAKAKKVAKDAYGEALLSSYWMFGNATPQERMEFEATLINWQNLNDSSVDNLIHQVSKEVPKWRENGTYLFDAVDLAVKDATLQAPDLQAILATEKKARQNILKKADKDPVGFQKAWAKRDAEIFNLGLPLILDTIVGGGVARLGGVKIAGRGAAVANSGEAVGVIKNGAATAAPRTAVEITGEGGVQAVNRTTEGYLANVEGATMVRSSDLGNIYELPNVGGVPEITLEAKARILAELEEEYFKATGERLQLAEVLKPGSPVRKPGGVAKVELTAPKTGKAAMVDAGAPPDVYGEASVWHSPTSPAELPEFKTWSKARQQAAVKEWNKANAAWEEWQNPAPGSKNERLQQCIGQKNTVPLDLEPNKSGVQRFVTAEFETVPVKAGDAQGELIRVKSYRVEVRVDGKTVNTKVVVPESEVALPQTPDADAVAVAKQVGTDASGKPILKALNRSEREFVMQKYIDKNIAARRAGLVPDAAEHGVTLVMDDASAQAAGKLLPAYGVPFLPEGVGKEYLQRIARFVKPKGVSTSQMYLKMVDTVQSEGGFGQHAVVVTKDTRYLGELNVSQW